MRFLTLLLMLLPTFAAANDWATLRTPGAFAIMRHALAPGTDDPANFALGDCSTQRNLDARGRAQARAIGDALRTRDIRFDQVLTSQWCRTIETAELLDLGAPIPAPALNSFFRDRSQSGPQTADLLAELQSSTGRSILVTHQVNIAALTGTPTRSGEIIVFRLTQDGTATEILGRILIAP